MKTKTKTKTITRRGMSTVLLYVRVPVKIKEKITYFNEEGYGEKSEIVSVKLIKHKLKFDLRKQDIIDSFNQTPKGEIQDCFEEDGT